MSVKEPSLAVRPRPAPFFLRRQFLRPFAPVASLTVVGLVALLVFANLLLPFTRLVTLDGAMGTHVSFFNDERVRELLLRHHMQVHVTRKGSREIANINLDAFDFVFPSGQLAANQITQRQPSAGRYRPFVSYIVLATYRGYAETLRDAGAATPQNASGFDRPYYYTLDMDRFLNLIHAQKSWNDVKSGAHGVPNGNKVLAQTTDLCTSNGAAAYLGLVSFATHDKTPTTEDEAIAFATEIKPLLDQGLPTNTPERYFIPEGKGNAPIIVMYEHQYLAYQLHHRERFGELDGDRVLLYPDPASLTDPELITLHPDADRLGDLLNTDPDLRRRELELGLRVGDPTRESSSDQLPTFLAERDVPRPADINTRAVLPNVPRLEMMLSVAGDCPPVVPE